MKQKLNRDRERRTKQRKKRPVGYIKMKKILLVEDIPQRQSNFLEKQGIDLLPFSERLINCAEEQYHSLIDEIIENKIDWTQYSTIIIHRSGFETQREILKDICQENLIKLVFFSGGISSTFYTDKPYEFLQLNSKDLYTQNLKLFLESNEDNLLELAYGDKWEINILLNKLEKINKFIEDNKLNGNQEKVLYSDFSIKINIDLLKKLIEDLPIEDGMITIIVTDIEKISKKILSKIKMKDIING